MCLTLLLGSGWEILGGNETLEEGGWEEIHVQASERQACQVGSGCALGFSQHHMLHFPGTAKDCPALLA